MQLGKVSLLEEAALLHDQDSVETEARRVRCRLTKQAAANELVFQALKNGGLHFTVEQRSCIAKELALSPQTSEQLDNDACQLRADFDSVAGQPDTVEYALHPGVASDPIFFEDEPIGIPNNKLETGELVF